MSSKRTVAERLTITDQAGAASFDVHGNLGRTKKLTLRDHCGQQLAKIKGHLLSNRFEILICGERAASVSCEGDYAERYDVDSDRGQITMQGLGGWDYTLSSGGATVATVAAGLRMDGTFIIDVADGADDVFILAIVLAIGAISDERRRRERHGSPGRLAGGLAGFR